MANGVNLINEDDAGGFLLGLFEQVAHLGSAHAHKHFHEFGAGHGEEGHVGFTGHRLGQHGLAGARRADEQDALGHLGTDVLVFAGVVQVVDDLLQVLLGFVLTGHIRKVDALGGLDVDLGIGFAHAAEHHRVGAAHLFHELFVHKVAQRGEEDDGQHEPEQEAEDGRGLLHDLAGKRSPGVIQALGEAGVVHQAGPVDLGLVFVGKDDLVALNVHTADVLFLGHAHKGAVIHLFDLALAHPRHQNEVEEQKHQQHDGVIDGQRLFRRFDFFHDDPPFFRVSAVMIPQPKFSSSVSSAFLQKLRGLFTKGAEQKGLRPTGSRNPFVHTHILGEKES